MLRNAQRHITTARQRPSAIVQRAALIRSTRSATDGCGDRLRQRSTRAQYRLSAAAVRKAHYYCTVVRAPNSHPSGRSPAHARLIKSFGHFLASSGPSKPDRVAEFEFRYLAVLLVDGNQALKTKYVPG